MFIGHALLAFAVAASVTARLGWSRERALSFGVVAGLFAAAPDVDMAYALVGLVTASATDALALAGVFWQSGNVVHRAVTHSLVVAPVVALAAGFAVDGVRRDSRTSRGGALVVATGLVAVAGAVSGLLGVAVMGLFCTVSLGIAVVTARRTNFDARTVALAALFGVASHPFGDLFTGEPPAMLYPFDVTLFAERVELHTHPTLHLLSAFGVELATIWAAVLVALWLTNTSLRSVVDSKAAFGVAYAASLFVIPAPTLDLSYPFVFSVLAVGMVGVTPRVRRPGVSHRRLPLPRFERPTRQTAVATGLTAVTLAWTAYSAVFLLA